VVPSELLRHLSDREDDAHAEADRLRAQITELTAQLEAAEQTLTRIQLTRQTLLEIAGQSENDQSDTTTKPLPPAYQQILAIFTHADAGLRAKDLCHALNHGDQPRQIENMRAKLKRLVGRDILTEPEPGLFAINRRET
jgi:multidrug resistance efflux pump